MKLVVNILDNELRSSKARINFCKKKKIGHVVKLMFVFLNMISSVVKIVLYLHFLYTKGNRLRKIKKRHE